VLRDAPQGNLLLNDIDGSCDQRAAAAIERIEWGAAKAARDCEVDTDCRVFDRDPECVFDCGFRSAVADPAALEAAMDLTDAACLGGLQIPRGCTLRPRP
jgi:hypothetical protein